LAVLEDLNSEQIGDMMPHYVKSMEEVVDLTLEPKLHSLRIEGAIPVFLAARRSRERLPDLGAPDSHFSRTPPTSRSRKISKRWATTQERIGVDGTRRNWRFSAAASSVVTP
jgi:hypothetical protein